MKLSRRGLFTVGTVFLAAPAIVRVSSLMPYSPNLQATWNGTRWVPDTELCSKIQWNGIELVFDPPISEPAAYLISARLSEAQRNVLRRLIGAMTDAA